MAVKDTEINKLNDAWIAQGQKVSDLNDKLNAAVLDDSFDEKQFNDLKGERDNAVARRDALHSQLDEARRAHDVVNMDPKNQQPLNNNEKSMKTKFVDDFKAMMRNDPKIMNILTSSEDDSGNAAGLTIPDDIQTLIHQLVRQFDSLEQYVNVEKVTTSKGSRVWEKWTDVKPLTDLDDESAAIGDNDDPQLKVVKYLIHRYAGISTVTNSLLKDTAENILAWLSQWIAKKVVVTRNTKIIAAMNDMPKKPSITSFDDVIHTINTAVDPAIKTTSFVMTNTSGLDILTRVTDGVGRPMLQPDPKQPDQYLIKGKTVVEIADRWLPNGGTSAAPTYPFYFGDLKQAVTLFDRESMSLLSTNIGGGAFEHDQTKVRVIDRFDVQPTDTEAFAAGSFTNITNATPTKSTTTDGATK